MSDERSPAHALPASPTPAVRPPHPGDGWRDAARVLGATVAFAAVHSLLATHRAKRLAARLVGERARDGWYRAFYNAQSVATTAALVAYVLRRPGRTVWHVRGPGAVALRVGQLAGLATLGAAARQIGVLRFAGLPELAAWATGRPIPPSQEAQGPRLAADGRVPHAGPFAWTRHPSNVGFLPVLWLQPHMTTARLALCVASTAYLVAGSRREEARLAARHGAAYEAYRKSGVPFFVPRPPDSSR